MARHSARRFFSRARWTTDAVGLKLARLVHDPCYRDGVIDVIGYAALLPEVTG